MQLSRDEAAVMLAALACRSDGQHDRQEADLVRKRLAPQLHRLGHGGEERSVEHLYELLDQHGLDGTLAAIRDALPGHDDRIAAMGLAGDIIYSDGSVTREEMEHLAKMGKLLGISRADLPKAR